ncbi:MAG: hypothetical protein HC859_05775, partial [Bacteroidia bacterium]|nr:hypothetical protein [Bacteroidia bacterium]
MNAANVLIDNYNQQNYNAYLAALREQADFAPAHFYLAHVYALLKLPADALTHFKAALAQADQLDPAQRSDAQKQVQTVSALLRKMRKTNAVPRCLPRHLARACRTSACRRARVHRSPRSGRSIRMMRRIRTTTRFTSQHTITPSTRMR